jgi:hypothetical protein
LPSSLALLLSPQTIWDCWFDAGGNKANRDERRILKGGADMRDWHRQTSHPIRGSKQSCQARTWDRIDKARASR